MVSATTNEGAALASVGSVGVAQPATVVASTTDQGVALISVPLADEGLDSHCGGRNDM